MKLAFTPLALTLACAASFPLLAQAQERLSVYAWAEYLPDTVLQAFTKETGIKIDYGTFDSNEAVTNQ